MLYTSIFGVFHVVALYFSMPYKERHDLLGFSIVGILGHSATVIK